MGQLVQQPVRGQVFDDGDLPHVEHLPRPVSLGVHAGGGHDEAVPLDGGQVLVLRDLRPGKPIGQDRGPRLGPAVRDPALGGPLPVEDVVGPSGLVHGKAKEEVLRGGRASIVVHVIQELGGPCEWQCCLQADRHVVELRVDGQYTLAEPEQDLRVVGEDAVLLLVDCLVTVMGDEEEVGQLGQHLLHQTEGVWVDAQQRPIEHLLGFEIAAPMLGFVADEVADGKDGAHVDERDGGLVVPPDAVLLFLHD
mmetsp:Transcript_12882/g.23200  ORF Transcript_12882/g.23200 Transcript_12882/m.23200 type:complete len:251 (-) Transcript_12882:376-1128(-)